MNETLTSENPAADKAMTSAPPTIRPVISAWSVLSPLGLDNAAFAAGMRAGRRTAAPIDPAQWTAPVGEACFVTDFDAATILGRKGTRSMDRITAFAVATVGRLLQAEGGVAGSGDDVGLVLGTSTGSAQSVMDFTRDSLLGEKPYFVDPARFPNTVLNCAAGQCAIRHGLRGPNTTIAGGRASGLLALKYALRLQMAGSAGTLLCGAVEELSSARAWLEWHSRREDEADTPLGEGCAMVLLESAELAKRHGRRALAEVVTVATGVYRGDDDIRAATVRCIRRALVSAGLRPEDVWLASASEAPGLRGRQEDAALEEVLGSTLPVNVRCRDVLGDACAASAAFQLAAVLAVAEERGDAAGSIALITSVDRDGVVACAVLRLLPDALREPFVPSS